MIKLQIPRLPAAFTGSGDLFAALFLAHSHLQGSIKPALEKTVNTLHEVLKKTYEHSKGKWKTIDKKSSDKYFLPHWNLSLFSITYTILFYFIWYFSEFYEEIVQQARKIELRLIESKKAIENPGTDLVAELLWISINEVWNLTKRLRNSNNRA